MAKLQDGRLFVLFLDLVKAFNRVVRELVHDMTEEPPRVDPKPAELIARLHRMACIQHAGPHEVAQTFTGGRRGWVFGTV
eukprot:7060080-Pyramimonas_sp.AAC.1